MAVLFCTIQLGTCVGQAQNTVSTVEMAVLFCTIQLGTRAWPALPMSSAPAPSGAAGHAPPPRPAQTRGWNRCYCCCCCCCYWACCPVARLPLAYDGQGLSSPAPASSRCWPGRPSQSGWGGRVRGCMRVGARCPAAACSLLGWMAAGVEDPTFELGSLAHRQACQWPRWHAFAPDRHMPCMWGSPAPPMPCFVRCAPVKAHPCAASHQGAHVCHVCPPHGSSNVRRAPRCPRVPMRAGVICASHQGARVCPPHGSGDVRQGAHVPRRPCVPTCARLMEAATCASHQGACVCPRVPASWKRRRAPRTKAPVCAHVCPPHGRGNVRRAPRCPRVPASWERQRAPRTKVPTRCPRTCAACRAGPKHASPSSAWARAASREARRR